MQVLLDDDIAAAREVRVVVADEQGVVGGRTDRVLGAVDEAEQVAAVEVAEAVHLVDDGRGAAEPLGHPGSELEAEVQLLGLDVEEQVARSRDRGVLRRR